MKKLKEESKIIIVYLIISFGWFYFPVELLATVFRKEIQADQLQFYKEFFHIIISSVLFYYLFKKQLNNLREKNKKLDNSLKSLEKQNKRFLKMITFVYNLDKKTDLSEEEFLSDLLNNIIEIIPEADYGKICLIKDDKCEFIDAVGHNIAALKKIKINKKNLDNYDSLGVKFSNGFPIKIGNIKTTKKENLENALKEIKESMYIDIKIKSTIIGRIFIDIAADSKLTFSQKTIHILESYSIIASSFFTYKRFNLLQGEFTKELVSSIIKILEIYDEYTRGHSEHVANLSMLIAEEMGLCEETVLDAYWSGMVHDIGKLMVPMQILNKTSQLEEFEYDIIKKHPVWSSEALADSETLKHISQYVLYHHERWDGSGYPEGLLTEDIPLVSQIIAVADSWDAMISNRSYRNSLTKEAALKEIKKNKGSQFSPRVVDAFLDIIERKELDIQKEVSYKLQSLESDFKFTKSQHFEHIFSLANEAMVILDENFKIKKANESFLKLFGYQESEILAKEIRKFLHPRSEINKNILDIEEKAVKGKLNLKAYLQHKNGELIYVEIESFPLSIGKKKIEYYVIYRDLSELKNIKDNYENLKQSSESSFENDSTAKLIINPQNGDIFDANAAAAEFYGFSREKMKSMNISQIKDNLVKTKN